MSFNSYQQLAPDMQAAVDRAVDSRLAAKSKTTVWWNPKTKDYWAASDPTSIEPDYGVRITNPSKLKGLDREKYNRPSTQALLQGGSASGMSATELDEVRYKNLWTNDFERYAVDFYDKIDRMRKQAMLMGGGTVTASDYTTISSTTIGNVMIDQMVLDLITRDFILLDAFTKKTWEKTEYKFDNRTPYLNQGGLGEFDIAPSGNVLYERGSISLKKAQGHVSISIWANMAVLDHDAVEDTTSIIDADFPRIFTEDAATTLTSFTNQATGGAYDVIAGGAFHSTTNPTVRFDADSLSIRNAGGRADTIVVNTQSYRALVQNTYMRLSGNPTLALGQPMPAVHAFRTTHELLPGYDIFVDEKATDDNLFQYDKRTAVFIEGPTSVRNVELNYGQVKDTVSDRWYGSGLKKSTWGVEQTNIHS